MDQTLAKLYGTNQPEGDETEKLAAAELANSLAADGELDLNNISDEDVEGLAAQVLAAEGGSETPAGDPPNPEADAQEKVAEADQLGRVMAHAYVQELRSIEQETAKTASAKTAGKGGKVLAHLKGMKGKMKASAAASKAVEKNASALDTLAERRAVEICEQNGIDPSKLTPVETAAAESTVEKTSAPAAEVLSAAVEARAIEMLKGFGVEVSVEE